MLAFRYLLVLFVTYFFVADVFAGCTGDLNDVKGDFSVISCIVLTKTSIVNKMAMKKFSEDEASSWLSKVKMGSYDFIVKKTAEKYSGTTILTLKSTPNSKLYKAYYPKPAKQVCSELQNGDTVSGTLSKHCCDTPGFGRPECDLANGYSVIKLEKK